MCRGYGILLRFWRFSFLLVSKPGAISFDYNLATSQDMNYIEVECLDRPNTVVQGKQYQLVAATKLTDRKVSLHEIMNSLLPIIPRFPRLSAPICRHCGGRSTPLHVGPFNPNGNAHRPFFRCNSIRCQQLEGEGFIAWDDNIGVHGNNPRCDCGIPSRQDRAGIYSPIAGQMFWRCADGTCRYRSYLWNGMTPHELHVAALRNSATSWSRSI